ncbi:MAG: 5'-3' exonuclease H3TH domain-containing protein [Clostridia bacterium]|nr:5'-3' exonuclease H3TH domain-containing protein [Clostridia bacterium]
MDRILIVDGSNLLFQMFFGMPSRIVNSEGKAIQGTLGFVGALLKIIRMTSPTHLAVFFDGEHENFRAKIDHGYKANRIDYSEVAEEESPFSQLQDIYAALDFLGVLHFEAQDCEADDIIAGYAIKYGNDYEIIISSFDSDFFQLITDKVSVLRYKGEKTVVCTPEYIVEKLGIIPSQYADFKSLTGDRADNIRGADKVGPKTAVALLAKFGTLKNILNSPEEIDRMSVRSSISGSRERLINNYKMIKLGNSAKLPFSLSEIRYRHKAITTTEILVHIGLK